MRGRCHYLSEEPRDCGIGWDGVAIHPRSFFLAFGRRNRLCNYPRYSVCFRCAVLVFCFFVSGGCRKFIRTLPVVDMKRSFCAWGTALTARHRYLVLSLRLFFFSVFNKARMIRPIVNIRLIYEHMEFVNNNMAGHFAFHGDAVLCPYWVKA